MPIKRDTIMAHRRVVNKMDYQPTAETVRMLCDGALELLDALEGGPAVQAQRAELQERERQLRLALSDVLAWSREAYAATYRAGDLRTVDTVAKVREGVVAALKMLQAKGPKWRREWAWYKPQIDEEFEESVGP